MENLFNNPLLIKLQGWGQKVGTNKFIAALTAGMMSTMAPIMVGAVCNILNAVATNLGLWATTDAIYGYIAAPYNFTMNMLGIWVTISIAYNYAKNLKMKSPVTQAIDAGIVFLMTCAPAIEGGISTGFLGSTGMFVGFVIAGCVVRIEKFCADKNIRIPMPDVCPPSLVNSFAAIIPLAFDVIVFYGLHVGITVLTGGALSFPTLLNAILMGPLSLLFSTPGMFILNGLAALLWCFGIHGSMIVYPIIMADMINAASTNYQLFMASEPLQFFPSLLFACVGLIGGAGNTWPLAIMGLKAKSKQIRAVAKVSVIPGWFGINEPMTFGMPIMYNPILCIPYVLNVLVITALYYFAYTFGIIVPPHISIQTLLPLGFGAYLGTLNIMNAVWVYLMIIPAALIWFPFFKVYDNQLAKQEAEAEAAEAAANK